MTDAREFAKLPPPTTYTEGQLSGRACCWCRLPEGGHVPAGHIHITDWTGGTTSWQLMACTACAAYRRIPRGSVR